MKGRLFCFGDSFVDWHLPKYHWTSYLTNHYDDVYRLGKAGADNYSILFQLGNLPVYEKGDRIVMVFTNPGRLPRRFYGGRRKDYIDIIYHASHFYKNKTFAKNLDMLKYDEEQRWINNERYIEIAFIKNLQNWLSSYKPIFVTWHESFYESTSDFVTFIQATTNAQEGVGDEEDFHPGPKGCYTWYETLHSLLEINESKVEFVVDQITKELL